MLTPEEKQWLYIKYKGGNYWITPITTKENIWKVRKERKDLEVYKLMYMYKAYQN